VSTLPSVLPQTVVTRRDIIKINTNTSQQEKSRDGLQLDSNTAYVNVDRVARFHHSLFFLQILVVFSGDSAFIVDTVLLINVCIIIIIIF